MEWLTRPGLFALACCGALGLGLIGVQAQEGGLDPSFQPGGGNNGGFNDEVLPIVLQPDGRILVGGVFTTVNRVSRNGVARLKADGSLDETFDPGTGADNLVEALVLQPDGKVIIGGRFLTVGGVSQAYLARLNADGSLDADFRPALDDFVFCLALQSDGQILVGGRFQSIGGLARPRLGRVQSNGLPDPTFAANGGPDLPVHTVAAQQDGKILIGGQFTQVAATPRARVARLQANGAVDAAFDPGSGADRTVYVVGAQADGRVMLGGEFLEVNGVTRLHLARLESTGALDESFQPAIKQTYGGVLNLHLQPDGKVLIVGDFLRIADGTGEYVWWPYVARLQADGSLDATFQTSGTFSDASGFPVLARGLAVQADGPVLVGGRFTTFAGVKINRIARLQALPAVETHTPRFELVSWLNPGTCRLTITALSGQSYVLEATSDFAEWTPLQTNVAAEATCTFEDASGGLQQRFYRVLTP